MGKRMRNGGERLPSAGFSKSRLLRQRIVESGLDASLDAELVASSLRKRYRREYGRAKLQPFSHQVSQVLASLRHPPTTAATSHDNTSSASDDSSSSPTIKHTRPRRHPSLSSSESHLQSDGSQSTSTSEGDSPDPKPAIDVTKLFLRDSLLKNNAPKQSLKRTREHNMEIDVPMEKPKEGYSGNSWGQEGKVGPRFVDLGGMERVIEELMNDVITPFFQPELLRFLGVTPISGLLLHGPPGCGKTTLAHAIANETGVSFYNISAPEVVSGVSGKSEENIRNLFNKAYRTAPSIVFIDEIDAIASKRENLQREMERGIVTQLMTCMDQFHQALRNQKPDPSRDKPPGGHVLVIGATNRPDAVDQALRRPGRFDREIALGVPCESARAEILSMLTQRMRLEGKFDLFKIARSTPGFVGADLKALADKAGNLAIRRINDKRKSSLNLEDWRSRPWDEAEMESLSITMADFEDAVKMIQPCLRREGFSSIPNVTWDDVGGLTSIREVFEWDIVYQIKHPQVHEELGINLEGGFLLFGPPGCGKTLIAKAVANESGANFIHIKGPELLSKYVGESESEVRKIFARARTNSPCIIFFDEVDALTASGKEGGGVVDRVLKQLLVELHGGEPRQGVYVIGATNRIEEMDPALLRPGRFEKILHVPIPGPNERVAIMKAYARKKPIDADVDLDSFALSERCNNLTGADLAKLMREAAKIALRERLGNETSISDKPTVKASHFEQALSQITLSTTAEQRRHYALQSRLYT